MITIFCDFSQFSAKIGVFLKYQCYDQLFSEFIFVLSQKRQFFAKFFGKNILKIKTSGPGRATSKIDRHVFCQTLSKHNRGFNRYALITIFSAFRQFLLL
jgi:hypothetical protein